MPEGPAETQPINKNEAAPKKRRTRALVVVSSIGVIVVIVLAAILISGFNVPRHHINAYGETLFTSFHSASGEVVDTSSTLFSVPSDDHYQVGRQVTWDETFHNAGTGVLNITSIVCTTSGFTFVGCSPSLPVTLPNTATKEEGAIMLTLTFDAPSTPYDGPLNYTIYYDHYPA